MPFFAAQLPAWPCGVGMRRVALVLWAGLLAGFAVPAVGESQPEVDTSRNGDLIEVRAQATINAPLPVIWGTLTDYDRLPDFIPGLKKSRVIARKGATTTVEQSGEARFLFLSVPIEVTLESTERPPYLEVRRIAGTLRHLQGRYETEVLADPTQVRLRWIGSIMPEADLPPLIGVALMRLLIEQQFVGMVREIERREAARTSALPAPAAK